MYIAKNTHIMLMLSEKCQDLKNDSKDKHQVTR